MSDSANPPRHPRAPISVVVVTGVSGAGKSTAVRALEDLGYFCVDNLPTPVMTQTVNALVEAGVRRVAFGIDVRVRGFLDDATLMLNALGEPGQRELLTPLRGRATVVIDTTRLGVNELRRQILDYFGNTAGGVQRLAVRFLSFGFKYGPPVDGDMVLDVRFLKNPHFVPELKPLSGRDAPVAEYVLETEEGRGFVERAANLLEYCLPRFEREGKSYVTVGIGCTGGRHRSVAITERLAEMVEKSTGFSIDVVHRDIDRVTLRGSGGDPDHGAPAGPDSGGHER